MNSAAILLDIVAVLYACASILYLWGFVSEAARARRMASITALLGLLVHGALIADICLAKHTMALTNLFGSLLFVAWSLMAIYLINERKYRITALGAFAAILCLSTVGVVSTLPNGVNETLRPALRSHWSVIHITSCLLGYAGFTLAFGAAICYVIQEYMLKAKRINVIQRHLPSLDVADHLAYTMVSFGFPLFTLGIVTGALWAQTAWNSYWSWIPKETWSLITWLVYAAYLHVRIVSRWRGKWANRLLIAGLVCVVVTFIGVNFFSGGLHNYKW